MLVKRLMLPSFYKSLSSPVVQYATSVAISLLYLAVLYTSDLSYNNIQLPEGTYANNIWIDGDVLTYVNPARNFLTYYTFGTADVPDYRRTIGYPLFLAVFMIVFGGHWLIATLVAQAFIFAFIFPALSEVARVLFGAGSRVVALSFLFLTLSGTYLVRIPIVSSDMFFAVLFTLGFCFGLKAIDRKSWTNLVMQIVLIGFAAQVRPLLGLYAVINLAILILLAFKKYGLIDAKLKTMILISSVFLVFLGNLPSLRNYLNHGFFQPTNVLAVNMFDFLAKSALSRSDRSDYYNFLDERLRKISDIREAIEIKEQYALQVYKQYPVATAFQVGRNAVGIMLRGHWTVAANFWGYNFADDIGFNDRLILQKSALVFMAEVFFNIVYFGIYVLSCFYLISLWPCT